MDESLGKYRLLGLLATGGMGEVFLARHVGPAGFSKLVVVKKILRHLAYDQNFIDMFLNEARLAAQLSHPNIVQIFELGHEEDTWFIAMEHVHGRSLRQIQHELKSRGQKMPPWVAARLLAQALQGLHYAHHLNDETGRPLGIVHRDISPDNVLIGFSGVVKLVDFGIAKAMNTISVTASGTLKGKYAYMAPELLRGNGLVDARTDIYAAGVVLYELLAGARPYDGELGLELLASAGARPAPELSSANPEVPEALAAVVMRALQVNPAERWSSAEQMAHALEGALGAAGQPVTLGQVAAFLRNLFGADAVASPSLLATSPEMGGGGTLALGTRVLADPRAENPTDVNATQLAPLVPPERAESSDPTSLVATTTGSEPTVTGLSAPPLVAAPRPSRPPPSAVDHASVTLDATLDGTGSAAAFSAPARRPGLGRWPWVGIAAVAAVALVIVGWSTWGRDSQGTTESSAGRAQDPRSRPTDPSDPDRSRSADADAALPVDPSSEPDAGAGVVEVQRPPRRRPTAPKTGKVTVRVNPWAEVFFEKKRLGITPFAAVELPAGDQVLLVRNKDLGISRKVRVKVPPGGEVVLKVDLFDKKP